MSPHQEAWLSRNIDRDEEWLKEMAWMGFEIHHIDGDHENNDPENLVLLTSFDHQLLHANPNSNGGLIQHIIKKTGFRTRREWLADRVTKGSSAYELRETGLVWRLVGDELGCSQQSAINCAKMYAEYHNKTWPIPMITKLHKPDR